VEPLQGFLVRLELTDGSVREVDLDPFMGERGVFRALREDPDLFRAVRVDPDFGTLIWPNGADLDPDALVLGRPPSRRRSGRPLRTRFV
jgi:hypothetical protein